MRLITPPLDIDQRDPFANDLFGRKDFATRLVNLFGRLEDNLVISINAPWGEGKTTFIKMLTPFMSDMGIRSIYFDAFENDHLDDPFIAIAGEISGVLENDQNEEITNKEKIAEFKSKASKAGVKLLSWTAKLGIKAATLGVVKDSDLEALQEIKDSIADDASEWVSSAIRNKLDQYKDDIVTINTFKIELEEIAAKIKDVSGYPLIFIIDELDRCRPSYALDMIEKIKHFFSVKNVTFVLVMNKAQIESAVRSVYGNDIDAVTYLQKFISVECLLPKNTDKYQGDHSKYCTYLYSAHDLTTWEDKRDLQEYMVIFSKAANLSLRELEKCYSYLTLFYSSVQERTFRITPVVALLAIAKIRCPDLYANLKMGKISHDEFVANEFVKTIASTNNRDNASTIEWFNDWMRYLLMAEEEFAKLDRSDPIHRYGQAMFRYSIRRNDVVPFFCERMDSFNFQS